MNHIVHVPQIHLAIEEEDETMIVENPIVVHTLEIGIEAVKEEAAGVEAIHLGQDIKMTTKATAKTKNQASKTTAKIKK